MDHNKHLYATDLLMGIFFITSFVTGLLKFTPLLRATGLNQMVLPSALISDIHDWSGILMGLFVCLHLYMNRRWIITMTRNIVHGSRTDT